MGFTKTPESAHTFASGLRLYFHVRDVFSGLIKAHFFGVIIAMMGSYYGLRSEGGAEGAGGEGGHGQLSVVYGASAAGARCAPVVLVLRPGLDCSGPASVRPLQAAPRAS